LIAALTFVVGVVLITVAETAARLDWTRTFAAGAITLGALGMGIYVGVSQPGHWVAARTRLAAARQPLGIALLVLVFVPSLAGLVAGMYGVFDEPDGTGWVVLIGAAVLVLMLVATAAAFAVGLQAVMRAGAEVEERAP
jgi:hypothetical protein